MPNGIPDAQLHPHMFLGEPGLPAVGLRALPAWKALTATYDEGFDAVLTLTDEQLTRRARDVQGQLARLLAWTPREPIQVEWLNPVEFRSQHLARAKASPMTNTDGTPRWTDEQLEGMADQAQRVTVAWSPEGPVIQLVRRRWKFFASLDLLDELLAHELVHQYQEEVFGLYDEGRFDEDMLGLPLEGHAGHLTQRWLDARAPGATHTAHPQAVQEFDALLELTGDTPDDLLRRFHDGMWSNLYPSFCSGFLLFPGDPWQPQPVVEVVRAGERPVLKLTNPGDTPLAGLYNGRWCAIDTPYSPLSHRAFPASPPFHLLLPPGASVQVRLTDALDGAEVGTRVRSQWSPTPSLVEMR